MLLHEKLDGSEAMRNLDRRRLMIRLLSTATLLAVVVAPGHAGAQQVALKAGVSASNLSLDDTNVYVADWQAGFVAGAS